MIWRSVEVTSWSLEAQKERKKERKYLEEKKSPRSKGRGKMSYLKDSQSRKVFSKKKKSTLGHINGEN